MCTAGPSAPLSTQPGWPECSQQLLTGHWSKISTSFGWGKSSRMHLDFISTPHFWKYFTSKKKKNIAKNVSPSQFFCALLILFKSRFTVPLNFSYRDTESHHRRNYLSLPWPRKELGLQPALGFPVISLLEADWRGGLHSEMLSWQTLFPIFFPIYLTVLSAAFVTDTASARRWVVSFHSKIKVQTRCIAIWRGLFPSANWKMLWMMRSDLYVYLWDTW